MSASDQTCLIVGASGLIGSALSKSLREQDDFAVIETHRSAGPSQRETAQPQNAYQLQLDLGDQANIDQFELPSDASWPTHVVLCAAMTNTAACEKAPTLSEQVNCLGPVTLCQKLITIANENKWPIPHFVFLSTSQVFDGEKPHIHMQAPHRPTTTYGRHKSEAEGKLRDLLGARVSIVRLTKVIGPGVFPLIASWREKLMNGQTIQVFNDRSLAPVKLEVVIQFLTRLMRKETAQSQDLQNSPTFQLSAREDVTYLELAETLAKKLRLITISDTRHQIESVASRSHPELVYPGPYSSLNTTSTLTLHPFEFMTKDQILDRLIYFESD